MKALAILPAAQSAPLAAVAGLADEFEIPDFQVFKSVPADRDFGIAALQGMVVVYDIRPLRFEGVVEGAFYVRESQRPAASRPWADWLRGELEERNRLAGPSVPLETRREVVRAIRQQHSDLWSVHLASGFVDGPYHDWWFGRDFVGKVVGIYRPTA